MSVFAFGYEEDIQLSQYYHTTIEIVRRKKRWLPYILPQYHASLIQPVKYKESQIFAVFVPVPLTLCMLGLKVLEGFCTFL